MPVVTKVMAEDVKNDTPVIEKRGRGRPKGSKNKPKPERKPVQTPVSGAAFITNTPPTDKRAYKWSCACGKSHTAYMRLYYMDCECGKAMKCNDPRGILKL